MYGEGNYQLRIINRNSGQCRIGDHFLFEKPVIETEDFAIICSGDGFDYNGDKIEESGVYEYTLTSFQGCDSTVVLVVEEEEPVVENISVQILEGSTFNYSGYEFSSEGEYEIEMVTSNGCERVVILDLQFIDIYIPNVFSPNEDGMNDFFEVFTSDFQIATKELSIYDRWGNLIHKGDRWDGKSGNVLVDPGVYVYVVRLVDETGQELYMSGDVTLLK